MITLDHYGITMYVNLNWKQQTSERVISLDDNFLNIAYLDRILFCMES